MNISRGLFLLTCIGCAGHWTTANTVLETTFMAEQIADAVQTQQGIVGCREANPIIGDCGQNVPPIVYFPVTSIIHFIIAGVLPDKYRLIFQGVTIGVQADNIVGNYFELRK